ncbi:MAG: hypothetical protein RIM23_13335 [Coleofasciculus sp. G3-WIS-01]|uniref:hypothetical protein n=1 Tax=Coleofasciculus sp. G3-WIS-01 TaxID=3069528 RepID=UPI0033001EE9
MRSLFFWVVAQTTCPSDWETACTMGVIGLGKLTGLGKANFLRFSFDLTDAQKD